MNYYNLKTDSTPEELIEQIASIAGLRNKLVGSEYLKQAVTLCYYDTDNMRRCLTSKLYPQIAEANNTSGERVERNIRTAIQDSYDRGKLKALNHLFGCDIVEDSYSPTNGDLIFAIATKLRYLVKGE